MESDSPCLNCQATAAGCEIRWFRSGRRCCTGEHRARGVGQALARSEPRVRSLAVQTPEFCNEGRRGAWWTVTADWFDPPHIFEPSTSVWTLDASGPLPWGWLR